jgi:hypothetical protein
MNGAADLVVARLVLEDMVEALGAVLEDAPRLARIHSVDVGLQQSQDICHGGPHGSPALTRVAAPFALLGALGVASARSR